MSKVVRLIAGAALLTVGIITGNPFLIQAGAGLTLGAFAEIVAGSGSAKRQAAVTSLQLGEQPRQAVLGQALVGGTLADGFNYGGKYGTDWEVLVILLADHLCDGLVGFYVNDSYVAFSGNGSVAGYNGQLVVTWYPGTATQAADPTLMAHGAWTAGDTLAGVSYVVVGYKADASDAKNPIWPSGRPRFSWLIRGKRCYDPRKDSTVAGGSGAHRWSDPTTWAWTDNLAVCRYNWARGIYACDRVDQPEQLLVGRGLSIAEAPPERVAAAANLCDEPVAVAAGGAEPRYRCAVVVAANEQFSDVEAKFAAACGGVLVQPEGAIEVEPGHAKPVVASITDADLVVGKPVKFSAFRGQADQAWINSVAAQYVEPKQKWAMHAAPVRRVIADLVADRGPREATPSLEYVSSGTQAQRCAEILRRQGRLGATATITLGPRFNEIEEGDWIVWTSARRTKGRPVTFRVEAYQDDDSWQKTLTLTQIDASCFAWAATDEIAEGAVAVQQTAPDPAAYVPGESASALQLAISTSFPIGLTITAAADGSITISDHIRRYTDGHADVAITGATIASGLAAGDFRAIGYDDADRAGGAVTFQLFADGFDAITSPDHPARHYLGTATIPTAGSPPSSGGGATPPGGYCVTVDTPLLVAPGTTKLAGEIVASVDRLWTRHEARLEDVGGGWGSFPVEAITIVDSDDVWQSTIGDKLLRATGDHLVFTGTWVAMRDIGTKLDGTFQVAKITVTDAHTYVSNGILSHNIKATQLDY